MKKYYIRNQNGRWHPTTEYCYERILCLMKHNAGLCEGIAICCVECTH